MDTRILRANSKAFKKQVAALKYDEARAVDLLYSATRDRVDAAFSRRCLFIVGTEYMFGLPGKDRIPLSGFYVDGNTGRITKKESAHNVHWFTRRLPKRAFKSEEVIREGNRSQ